MKKKMFFTILFFLIFIPNVFAFGGYYKDDEGKYWLCPETGDCFSIVAGQAGANFDLRNNIINYEGYDYYYDVGRQTDYEASKLGTTTMYYYMKGDSYVLCTKVNACKTYTFDSLVNLGASINYQDSIVLPPKGPGERGEVYYFNTSMNEANEVKPIEKPVFEAKTDYCTRLKEPLEFLGRVVLIVKILIPIIIIGFGMIDFFKAIIGSKDDEIKKSARSFLFRCISGVIIFFIPTIVSLVFSLVSDFANIKGDFDACQKCIFRVSECK